MAIHPQSNQIVLGDRKTFKYDFVFGPRTQQVNRAADRSADLELHLQEELYQSCIAPMLNNVFDGYNVTIFAYGQTVRSPLVLPVETASFSSQGSGKTFTITGGNISSIGEKDFGIVPRAVQTIFDTLEVCRAPLCETLDELSMHLESNRLPGEHFSVVLGNLQRRDHRSARYQRQSFGRSR